MMSFFNQTSSVDWQEELWRSLRDKRTRGPCNLAGYLSGHLSGHLSGSLAGYLARPGEPPALRT